LNLAWRNEDPKTTTAWRNRGKRLNVKWSNVLAKS